MGNMFDPTLFKDEQLKDLTEEGDPSIVVRQALNDYIEFGTDRLGMPRQTNHSRSPRESIDIYEVLEKIKEISPSTDVIMVTGVGGHEVGMESFKQGAFEFVTKPIDLARLKFLLDFRLGQMGLA